MSWSTELNPWYAKGVVLAASVAMIAIRAPHGHRSGRIQVVKHRKDWREKALLTLAWASFFIPLVWVVAPVFDFAEYPLRLGVMLAGAACFAVGLWLFHRSHADLGVNWSITLELREGHRLTTHGVYRRIRHPMYAALFLHSIGQALVVPNWIAGPSYLAAFTILFAVRLKREEAMLIDEFGDAYRDYMQTTKRLIPGVW